jgi:hypothetical protein
VFQPRSATLLRDDAVAGDIVEDEDKENDPATSDPTTMRRPPPFAVPSGPPPPVAVPPAIHHQATSSAMVPVNEVSDIVNAAIAGDPPRPSAAIKGGAAAAMASIADVVRRAVTDARREGASIGASETRLALQRSTAKAQESAAAAVRAAEESQRVAEEKARAAEERRKVLEIESNTKSKQLSKQLEEKQGDLGDKLKTLRARADAATNEATALRAELKREKEKNESIRNTAEKNDATEARFKALTVESKRAREEAKKLKFEMDSRVEFETKQVQRELANERARSAKELAWFQSEMREMTASCDAAVAAAREEAFSATRTAAQETARLRAEFTECRELISRASSAVSARHRKALMTVMKKESWTRDEMEQLRNELEQERDARLKLKGAQFEKTSELDEALRTVEKLKVERDDADRAKVAAEAKASLIDDAFRARDDAMSTAMSAKMEKDAADAAAKSAAQEVEAAWAAAATAEAEMAEEHKRALGEEGAKVYRVVRNDLRALRRRYFVRMGRTRPALRSIWRTATWTTTASTWAGCGKGSASRGWCRRWWASSDGARLMLMRSATWASGKNCDGWRSACSSRSPVTWKTRQTTRARRLRPKMCPMCANHPRLSRTSGHRGPPSRISRLIARRRANAGAGT